MNAITPNIAGEAMCLVDLVHSGTMIGEARVGDRRFWTAREIKILRDNYPEKGLAGCLPLLPGRTAGSIYQQAGKAGLCKGAQGQSPGVFRQQRWGTSDAIDAVIRREYPIRTHKGAVKEISRIVGRPEWWVSKRAVTLGLTTTRRKEPDWSAEEEQIAAELAGKDPACIARVLKAKGFHRTPTAVVVKLKRLGESAAREVDPNHYTARSLADAMGVEHSTVRRWVMKGYLKAQKKPSGADSTQAADEWRITRKDIRTFIANNVQVIDLRKVEKHWFVDLLVNRSVA